MINNIPKRIVNNQNRYDELQKVMCIRKMDNTTLKSYHNTKNGMSNWDITVDYVHDMDVITIADKFMTFRYEIMDDDSIRAYVGEFEVDLNTDEQKDLLASATKIINYDRIYSIYNNIDEPKNVLESIENKKRNQNKPKF